MGLAINFQCYLHSDIISSFVFQSSKRISVFRPCRKRVGRYPEEADRSFERFAFGHVPVRLRHVYVARGHGRPTRGQSNRSVC